ncbi:MAG: hypothetical protein AAGD92_01175 [Pseudomonadota bacterium]
MKFFTRRRAAQSDAPRFNIVAGEDSSAWTSSLINNLPGPSTLENKAVVDGRALGGGNLSNQFSDRVFSDWWTTDYSVEALKERGEFEVWEAIDAPIFSFGGKQWTAYHMPLCDEAGSPSPKLLLAAEIGSLIEPERTLGFSKSHLDRLREKWASDENAKALAYFDHKDAGEQFAAGLEAAIAKLGANAFVRGIMAPAHLTLNNLGAENKTEADISKVIFRNCCFFGTLTFKNATLDMLRFINCSFIDHQSYIDCNIGFLWWYGSTYAKALIGREYRKAVYISSSNILEINSNNFAPETVSLKDTNIEHGIYFYHFHDPALEYSIEGGVVHDIHFIAHPNNRDCEPAVRSRSAVLTGEILVDANMNVAEFELTNCNVHGMLSPYGMQLHPRSNFSGTSFHIRPAQYADAEEKLHEIVSRKLKETIGYVSPTEFSRDAKIRRYITGAENGFRQLRKLAKDNKQTDYELDFYVKQYEARRLREDLQPIEKAFMWVYKSTSLYGTSLARPIGSALFYAIALFAIGAGLAVLGSASPEEVGEAVAWVGWQALPQMPPALNALDPPDALTRIFQANLGLLYAGIIGAKIVSFTLIALFVIALRRRFQIE